jgi:hypothetical protein
MSKTLMALFAAAGLCLAGASTAQTTTPHDKAARDQAIKAADSQYKADKDACKSLSGNAKDICMQEAKGKEKVAKADAKAQYDARPRRARTRVSPVPRPRTTSPRKSATT